MLNKGLVNIDFDKSTNWILFLSGIGVGFFGFSIVVRLFTYITNAISGYMETKFAVYLSRAQENLTGAAIFLIGGVVLVKVVGTLLTFLLGFVLGLGARFIAYNHLGIIPDPDVGQLFGIDPMQGLENQTVNTTLNQTINQTA